MTRAQRYFLAIGILFLAWLFHVNMCEWHWRANVSVGQMVGGQWLSYPIWTRTERGGSTTGLTTQEWIDPHIALIWGVFLPATLVVGDVWWMLGWRRQRRAAAGHCLSCGYDLKGSPASQCPECGTARST